MRSTAATFICSLGLLIGQAQAHCDLAITSFNVSEDCLNSQPYASAQWSGGTPPYTISAVTGYGYLTGPSSSDNWGWSGSLASSDIDYEATITVTDALGCSSSAYVTWTNHYPVEPEITLTEDCVLGNILRWTGKYTIGGGSSMYIGCTGPLTYFLYNTSTNVTLTGSINAEWIQESGTTWRYPSALPNGDYFLHIATDGSAECNTGAQVLCIEPAYFTAPVNPSNCGTMFHLRALLAGPLQTGTLMSDQLRSADLLPTMEPYSAMGYSYTGITAGATIQPALLAETGNNAIVDWVIVELRSASNPATVVYSRPALIQRDGDVVGMDGNSFISTSLQAGNYHVAIRHRNHLGVMTASPIALSSTAAAVDFTSSSTATYGTNARQNVSGTMVIWPGDGNGNGTVQYTGAGNDRDPVLIAIDGSVPSNTVNNVYSRLDINMDGTVSYSGGANDRDVILQAVGGTAASAVRVQQLP